MRRTIAATISSIIQSQNSVNQFKHTKSTLHSFRSMRGKAVAFEIQSQEGEGKPRLGLLNVKGRRTLETPGYLAVSSRGVVPHISPDVLASQTDIGGVHLALEDFTEKATSNGTPPILKCPGQHPLHTFTALPGEMITLLAPRRTPAVQAPIGNTNTAISLFTSTGFQVLSNKQYISYVDKLKPDIAIGLGDVPYGTVAGKKRTAKMSDRTAKWLGELLKEKSVEQAVFAPVLPIDIQDQWEYLDGLADDLAGADGLAFYDSNLLPDIPATTALTALPRLSFDEPASPHHILRQVSLGMDVFTIPFITFATDAGIALDFTFPSPSTPSESSSPQSLGIDMWNPDLATSLIPLSKDCKCYTCTSHHRAFVQHLLAAKEMLGWVLIQVHNHHILSQFFESIRRSIKAGSFDQDAETFARVYESELPEKTGQGPRVRGYHFKSEGPNEKRKNKAAWGNLGGDDQDVEGGGPVPKETSDELQEKGFAKKAADV